jgi:hypothetical protein
VPSPFAELGAARSALGLATKLRRKRKLVLRRRRDLENVYLETLANLEAIRAGWSDPHLFRWNRLGQTLSTDVWRSTRYALTDPVDGSALDDQGEMVAELDALAAEFDRAKHQTFLSSDWEVRLLDVCDQLRELISHGTRRRPWHKVLTTHSMSRDLPAPSRGILTPSDMAEMQRRTIAEMRARIPGTVSDDDVPNDLDC